MGKVALIMCNDMHMDIERANELLAYIAKNPKFQVTNDYTLANTVVIMTCAFGTGKEGSLRIIADVQRNAWKFAEIIITGCLLKTNPNELSELFKHETKRVKLMDFEQVKEFFKIGKEPEKPLLNKKIPQNKVIISTGCLKRCSYCVYPQIADKYISKPMEDIWAEVDELAKIENTIYLTGAHETSDYGVDILGSPSFVDLLESICSKHKNTNFVIGWFHPAGLTPKLFEVLKRHKNVIEIMIHIQHVNDEILKAMKRPSFDWTESRLWELKRIRPDIKISTEVIVGFPGETEEKFYELVKYLSLSEELYSDIGVAAYEPVEGTVAAMLPDLPDYSVRMDRMEFIAERFSNVTKYPAPRDSNKTLVQSYYDVCERMYGIPKMILSKEVRQKLFCIAGTDSEYKDIECFVSLMRDVGEEIFNARDELAINRLKERIRLEYTKEFREYVYMFLFNAAIKQAMLEKAKRILLED